MMTEYRAHIRSRLGPRIAAGLDGLTPLFAQGQARRSVEGQTSRDFNAAGNLDAAQVFGPQSSASQVPRSIEQTALITPRRNLAARVGDDHRNSQGIAGVTPTGLRLVADQDRPDLTARYVAMSSRDVVPSRSRHEDNEVLHAPRPVKDDGQNTGLKHFGPRVAAAIPMLRLARTENIGRPVINTRVQSEADAQTSHVLQRSHAEKAASLVQKIEPISRSSSEIHRNQSIVDMLQSAASRRAVPMNEIITRNARSMTDDLSSGPKPPIGQQQTAPLNPMVAQPGFTPLGQLRSPVSRNSTAPERSTAKTAMQDAPVSPLTQLDRYLPIRDVRSNAPLAAQPQSGSAAPDEDAFAFDLRVQAALSRLLQSDMRRHGLHPHGEIL